MVAAESITQYFMLVLCALAMPAGAQESTLDLVSHGGVETIWMRRVEDGFAAYDQPGKAGGEQARIKRPADRSKVYVIEIGRNRKEVDLSSVKNLHMLTDGKAQTGRLVTGDGSTIHFTRSGDILYLQPSGQHNTYVVH